MAVIKPFRGMRYDTSKAGEISKLCCPPYDIISEKQRLDYINENEYNIIRLELPKELPALPKLAGKTVTAPLPAPFLRVLSGEGLLK